MSPIQDSSRKHLLVVEDDDLFRGALTRSLQLENFDVTAVADGASALQIVLIDHVDAVITDINMPGMSGAELLRLIREKRPELPVILMTAFPELRAASETLGAQGLLSKPFEIEELLALLRRCLAPPVQVQPVERKDGELDEGFCKIAIDDFITGKHIGFDIFIRLSATNYVKIANQGEDLPLERIRSYKAKGVRHLYMHREGASSFLVEVAA